MENDVLYNRIMNVVHEEYGPPGGEGTKEITITENGTTTEDVRRYASAEITVTVPNSYTESDEGKVVDNGVLVSQSSATYTENDTYDTTLVNEVTVNVGSSIDLSAIEQEVNLWNIGGLFKSFQNGNWDYLEYTCVSGTNPITIDFGRKINGFICYPKSAVSPTSGENISFTMQVYSDTVDEDTGKQELKLYCGDKTGTAQQGIPRVGNVSMINGVLSMVPSFPASAPYNPFGFTNAYIFVYWW